jgi:4-hydroxybutyryl-CoA dehydratase/vinylacetyl-CoA-Delta-isomerase
MGVYAVKTKEQYEESIRDLNFLVYMWGKRGKYLADNPVVSPSFNTLSMTYEMAHTPEYVDIATATSHITGEKISRFNHICQCIEDLIKKDRLNKLFNGNNGSSFHRTISANALNALSLTTDEIDDKYGTDYHMRFQRYLKYVHDNDLTCNGTLSDPREEDYLPAERPSTDDLLMHVVEKREKGIIVRGTKVGEIDALNSHEIIIVPTSSFDKNKKKYALSFALPSDTEGITYLMGDESGDTRKLGGGMIDGVRLLNQDSKMLCLFDNVFVPWERVFMCEEHDFSEQMAEMFKYSFCF